MLRFTIRDVLWLTLVVGLAVGWWLDRERLMARAERAEDAYELLQRQNDELRVRANAAEQALKELYGPIL